jgi:hypothetical protein
MAKRQAVRIAGGGANSDPAAERYSTRNGIPGQRGLPFRVLDVYRRRGGKKTNQKPG